MYSSEELLEAIRNPRLAIRPFRRKIYDYYFSQLHDHDGLGFMKEDWDNLLILDACRYDLFKEANTISGKLSAVQSPASETETFLKRVMDGDTFPDTVYVTANPQVTKIDADFHSLHCLWDTFWDDEHDTVLPEDVTDYVMHIDEEFKDKRLVVHYIQPHMPFIGPTAEDLSQSAFEGGTLDNADKSDENVWEMLEKGNLSKERAWKAYRENLEIALDGIKPLIESLNGKTVITSDHGNALGEWGIYGHPTGRTIDAITTVPWLELDYDSRKEISTGKTTESVTGQQDGEVQDRLEHLGYI